jgi:hypothetical protein
LVESRIALCASNGCAEGEMGINFPARAETGIEIVAKLRVEILPESEVYRDSIEYFPSIDGEEGGI